MNKKFNFLGKGFQEAIQKAVESESLDIEIKKLETKQKLLRDEAIDRMNKIRLAKVKKLHNNLKNYRLKIKKILEQRESIVKKYCQDNGHNFVRMKTKTHGSSKYHSFAEGHVYNVTIIYKCTVCGEESSIDTIDRPRLGEGDDYKCVIPEQCLNSTHSKNGKTFIELTNELKELLIKEKYVLLVLEEMCKLFGHDAEVLDPRYSAYDIYRTYKCNCCKKQMGIEEYEENYSNAIYKGIVDYKGQRYSQIRYTDLNQIIDLTNIDINLIQESIVVPGTKCEEEEKAKQLQKTRKQSYFDFSEYNSKLEYYPKYKK